MSNTDSIWIWVQVATSASSQKYLRGKRKFKLLVLITPQVFPIIFVVDVIVLPQDSKQVSHLFTSHHASASKQSAGNIIFYFTMKCWQNYCLLMVPVTPCVFFTGSFHVRLFLPASSHRQRSLLAQAGLALTPYLQSSQQLKMHTVPHASSLNTT